MTSDLNVRRTILLSAMTDELMVDKQTQRPAIVSFIVLLCYAVTGGLLQVCVLDARDWRLGGLAAGRMGRMAKADRRARMSRECVMRKECGWRNKRRGRDENEQVVSSCKSNLRASSD